MQKFSRSSGAEAERETVATVHLSACPRNSVTSLRFCFDHNSEIKGRRELSDVLN